MLVLITDGGTPLIVSDRAEAKAKAGRKKARLYSLNQIEALNVNKAELGPETPEKTKATKTKKASKISD